MKAYWGSGSIAPRILDLGTRWRWMVNFTPRPLCPHGKSPWYPLDRRLGELQSRSGRGSEEKNPHPLPGLELPNIQPLAQRYTIPAPITQPRRFPKGNMPSPIPFQSQFTTQSSCHLIWTYTTTATEISLNKTRTYRPDYTLAARV
jgi:hypothetical protein